MGVKLNRVSKSGPWRIRIMTLDTDAIAAHLMGMLSKWGVEQINRESLGLVPAVSRTKFFHSERYLMYLPFNWRMSL